MTKLPMFVWAIALLVSPAAADPLEDAVRAGDVAQALQLIEQGEDVNQDSGFGTPLYQAKTAEMAELLIKNGANVNAENASLGTPLQTAAHRGNEAVAAVLIANGADVNARDARGLTPLHAAAEGGYVAIVEMLIESGADVNARTLPEGTHPGYAPIYSAGEFGHFDVVALLRAYGAVPPAIEPVSGLIASADPDAGAEVFHTACVACHSVAEGARSGEGPNLWGVLGREKASVEDYTRYSEGFKRLVGTWTLAEFNAYIASPVDYVPGTRMRIKGVKDPTQRADLIAFLRQNSADPPPLPQRP
jgi:cytochrome c